MMDQLLFGLLLFLGSVTVLLAGRLSKVEGEVKRLSEGLDWTKGWQSGVEVALAELERKNAEPQP